MVLSIVIDLIPKHDDCLLVLILFFNKVAGFYNETYIFYQKNLGNNFLTLPTEILYLDKISYLISILLEPKDNQHAIHAILLNIQN